MAQKKAGFNIKELVGQGGSGSSEPSGPPNATGASQSQAPIKKPKKKGSSGQGEVLPPKPSAAPPANSPPPMMTMGGY